MVKLYTVRDRGRLSVEDVHDFPKDARQPFTRDIDRLVHSTCFRRLQGKTQLYPGIESDFFRNRLTHSIEVSKIAMSIANNLNKLPFFRKDKIDLSVVEFAGLAHDLGHPPFGHQGEDALNELMKRRGGYEGNAQTLRLLTKIEKKGFSGNINYLKDKNDTRKGLNLCARTLASILKYDKVSGRKDPEGKYAKNKGYYSFDADLVKSIKEKCGGHPRGKKFKTIECQIMDVADDIAYSTYDLEDGLKAGFYTLFNVVFPTERISKAIAKEIKLTLSSGIKVTFTEKEVIYILQELFSKFLFFEIPDKQNLTRDESVQFLQKSHELSMNFSSNGYLRNHLTSSLVNTFIQKVEFEPNVEYPAQSKVFLNDWTLVLVEVLKKFTYTSQVLSSRLKIAEYRGKEIVNEIFGVLSKGNGFELLPDDYRDSYEKSSADKRRIICDFVAGMTDSYAIEFYARLKSENAETIFKPL